MSDRPISPIIQRAFLSQKLLAVDAQLAEIEREQIDFPSPELTQKYRELDTKRSQLIEEREQIKFNA